MSDQKTMEYLDFLRAKIKLAPHKGFDVAREDLNPALKPHTRDIVAWAKKTHRPQMGRFGAQCEYVVWGSAGPMPAERGVGCLPGFYEFAYPTDREHVTQKPVDLMEAMVEICPGGGVVRDPFMGSGTTGVAAIRLGRRFVGCEQSAEYFEIACRRIEEAHRQRPLFAAAPEQGLQLALEVPA